MWIFTLITLSCGFIAQVMSHDIKVHCFSSNKLPSFSLNASASLLKNLTVEEFAELKELHIKWAVNVDVSNKHLTGTRIQVGLNYFLCEYTPSFANANLTGLTLLWFKLIVPARHGNPRVEAANLPFPPVANGDPYLTAEVMEEYYSTDTGETLTEPPDLLKESSWSGHEDGYEYTTILVALFGVVLAGSVVLGSCLILCKAYKAHIVVSGDFSLLPASGEPPVCVLLVYPAECPAFQGAVVALAEFLQEHGGFSVAVDLWQQGQIAELGPMRWVAGQAKAADRVLVVCPQTISCHSHHGFLGPSVPASASDLYPLVLNMVASHAKNPSELALFWAVQLGKSQDDSPRRLPGELTACKMFSLTKDLDKLCRSLHDKKQDSLIQRRPHIFYNEKSMMKLHEAIGQLTEHQSSITAEQEHFNSVVVTV
ncbi:unnamed protein product [Gadus morhua 'NCC']